MHKAGNVDAEHAFSVLIVDSDADFRKESSELVASRGHRAWGAPDLIAAINFLHDQTPDLLMIELALLVIDGADPLNDLRAHAPSVPLVILNDGEPSDAFQEFSRVHEVFGYHDKEHGQKGLKLWLDSALLLARHMTNMRKTRDQLRQVLESIPHLHQIQSLDQVLEAILLRIYQLLGGDGSFVAARTSDPVGEPPREGPTMSPNEIADYVVGAASLDYPTGASLQDLESVPLNDLRRAIDECQGIIQDNFGVLPLSLGEHVLGLAYLDKPESNGHDSDVLQLFASQAAAAIRNAALYELATIDSTTRVFRKTFLLERLRETIKLGWRKGFPISVLMADIDRFKEINDGLGHIVGDRALAHVAQALKAGIRDSDVVGRLGEDEFLVILIDADQDGAQLVADRLNKLLTDSGTARPEGVPPVEVSFGIASLEPDDSEPSKYGFPDIQRVIDLLIERSDRAMRDARREAGYKAVGPVLKWADLTGLEA